MELEGKYVETKKYKKTLEKYGFKYSPMTGSLILSYPFVPKEFAENAVRIELENMGLSHISKIASVEYLCKGSGYKRAEKPKEDFKKYTENILFEAVKKAYPKDFVA